MARNQAIVIGINQYEFLQPLRYAKQDALAMQRFLLEEAQFDRVFLFTDDSLEIGGKSTRPSRANLRQVFRELFETPFLGDGDNFWFFFGGHGMRSVERDYLMPIDGDPHDVENTGISINFISEKLRQCGADNVVLMLDACRNVATRAGEGIGNQAAENARQMGVISLFACSPNQFSYELEAISQGAFTKAVLEGLGMQGRCSTVERLSHYLEHRVPELVRQYYPRANQTPYTIAEPITKSHLVLMPRHATLQDAETLKKDALTAEVEQKYELAEQLWIRVLAVSPADPEAIKAIRRLALIDRDSATPSPTPSPTVTPSRSTISKISTPKVHVPPSQSTTSKLPIFEFDIVTIVEVKKSGLLGQKKEVVTKARRGQAEYFTEDLIKLDMISIPGGSFKMGALDGEEGATQAEYPQHLVTIAPFFMGKYPITQKQWKAIAQLPKVNLDLNPDPSHFKGDNRPVGQVSWDDAIEFCDRLSRKTGKQYRLPSEAEWEYACRAGTTTPFHFGATITTDLANYRGTDWKIEDKTYPGNYGDAPKGIFREQTTEVGSFPANAFGLYDMHGNVWEWCADSWHQNYKDAPIDGRVWQLDSDRNNKDRLRRVLRGGSWLSNPQPCRSAFRPYNSPGTRVNVIGFRVVCSAPRTL